MMTQPLSRLWSAVIGQLARAARPHFLPLHVALEGQELAQSLRQEYHQAVVQGYMSARQIIAYGPQAVGKKGLKKGAICQNLRDVQARFNSAARSLDPDGLAAETVKLFCVGVPHMDSLDNQRRVVAVWSALLAPSVVLRQAEEKSIKQEDLLEIACEWLETGATNAARICAEQSDTRFIASHPARIYELLADTAAKHNIDFDGLLASVIHPVVLSIGRHVGALQAANGRVVAELDELLKAKEE